MFRAQASLQWVYCKRRNGPTSCAKKSSIWFSSQSFHNNSSKRCYSRKHRSLTRTQLKKYCDILGVPVNASEGKIKQSFYKKSLVLHPDLNRSSDSSERFNEVSDAYQALLNYKKQTEHQHTATASWHKDKSPHFRPWFQTHRKPPPQSSHQKVNSEARNSHEPVFDSNENIGSETSAAFRHHSQASGWCNDNYRKQLAEAFSQKKNKQIKKEENESCVLM